MAKSSKTVKVTRSAKTGKFVPKKQAISKPSTTVTQTIRRTSKKRG
jgi:hypothetical protein